VTPEEKEKMLQLIHNMPVETSQVETSPESQNDLPNSLSATAQESVSAQQSPIVQESDLTIKKKGIFQTMQDNKLKDHGHYVPYYKTYMRMAELLLSSNEDSSVNDMEKLFTTYYHMRQMLLRIINMKNFEVY
jgi:hypothetical protein